MLIRCSKGQLAACHGNFGIHLICAQTSPVIAIEMCEQAVWPTRAMTAHSEPLKFFSLANPMNLLLILMHKRFGVHNWKTMWGVVL